MLVKCTKIVGQSNAQCGNSDGEKGAEHILNYLKDKSQRRGLNWNAALETGGVLVSEDV